MAFLVFHKAVQECLFLFFGQSPTGSPVRFIALRHKFVIVEHEPFHLLFMERHSTMAHQLIPGMIQPFQGHPHVMALSVRRFLGILA